MSGSTLQLDDRLQQYLHEASLREPAPCRRLRERAGQREDAELISSPEQVQLLALLGRLMGAHRVLEVGTYVGYTSLWLALALGEEARFSCIDHDEEVLALAREAWQQAGIGGRIELLQRDALEALDGLLEIGEAGCYDIAYIDADKERLLEYYEHCLRLVRPGGIVAVDNTLWKGSVADQADRSPATEAVRAFNQRVHADDRVDLSLVPIGDGMTLLRKLMSGETSR